MRVSCEIFSGIEAVSVAVIHTGELSFTVKDGDNEVCFYGCSANSVSYLDGEGVG